MRVLTKMLRKTIILGLAGLGAYKAWELVSANLQPAREQADRIKEQLRPAVHDATTEIADASRNAVAGVADAAADAARGETTASTASQPSFRTA
jgi:hypothetical protein